MKYLISVLVLCSACTSLLRTPAMQELSPEQTKPLGAVVDQQNINLSLRSKYASRVQVYFYKKAFGSAEAASYLLEKTGEDLWQAHISINELEQKGLGTIDYQGKKYPGYLYGYRLWGPNWVYDSGWKPGSDLGFKSDVDELGNRFNPNKLILDPYAKELSHDPVGFSINGATPFTDNSVYATGPKFRNIDSGDFAPKAVIWSLKNQKALNPSSNLSKRALKDEIIYEVHLRGFTKNDPSVPKKLRGTYSGAALKAGYLKSIGVTAVEFLPIHETVNEQNDTEPNSTNGDNYWGYMTLNYFSPDRRYSSDKSPGGPTREFQAMVETFHKNGIKVYLDVVYNHTAEGGLWNNDPQTALLWSWRGIDNPSYYLLTEKNDFYWQDMTGCGNHFNAGHKLAANLIIDSLSYWKNEMGVDGFRFDLAPPLGTTCDQNCYKFSTTDPNTVLNRAVKLNTDLIAEPWAIGAFELGRFPSGWAEWNGRYRDTIREAQNKRGFSNITPADLMTRIAGSDDLFNRGWRKPWQSINFIAAHDGFTLRDIYSYNERMNNQPWPFGESDGGESNNNSWDQRSGNQSDEQVKLAQRQAARTGFAFLMLSAGTPMITGGDEFYRTQYGNNNVYNLDSEKNWLDWSWQNSKAGVEQGFHKFASTMMQFRNAHPALRRENFFTGQDQNQNGLKDIEWLNEQGREANDQDKFDVKKAFVAYRIDATEAGESTRSILVAYNFGENFITMNLPSAVDGHRWYRVADTASWFESENNIKSQGQEDSLNERTYGIHPKSILLLIEK